MILAKEMGLCYACVAMATDYDCWHDTAEKVGVANVLKIFHNNVEKVTKIICCAVELIREKEWDKIIDELQVSPQLFIDTRSVTKEPVGLIL